MFQCARIALSGHKVDRYFDPFIVLNDFKRFTGSWQGRVAQCNSRVSKASVSIPVCVS